jgi:type IV secretion system protein VirB10
VKPEPGSVRDSNAVHDTVVGERSIASVNAPSSLQTRISHLLAMGLMSTLGLALLGWYYAHTWTHQAQARKVAENTSRNQATGEMALPSLKIDPPSPVAAQILGPPPALPATSAEASATPGQTATLGPAAGNPQGLPTKSPWQLALERRLAGPVSTGPAVGPASGAPAAAPDAKASPSAEEPGSAAPADTPLSASLKPSVTPAARARVLPAERLLLPKGAFIDCTLETAIDSTLPGMTTCVTATDTFGIDGSTVLIERGSKLVGETRGEARQGQSRLFVLWTEARTPTGVVVPLASPGTDELGRSGLPGEVSRHFFQRFGAAILISVIDGAVQGAVASQTRGGAVIYNPSASQDVMTEVLKSTVNIPPTIRKAQGDRIQVLVARDLDFRSVYELKSAAR